jgi:hypothetical protein
MHKLTTLVAGMTLASAPVAADPLAHDDPDHAVAAAIAGTVVPIALFGIGVERDSEPFMIASLGVGTVTPALGQFYGGRYLTYGMAARVGGLGLMLAGWRSAEPCVIAPCKDNTPAQLALWSGLAAYVGGIIYDVATSRRHAREAPGLTIAPITLAQGAPAVGLALSVNR